MAYIGTYDDRIFYNPKNGFCVFIFKTSDTSIPESARSSYRSDDRMIRFTGIGENIPQIGTVQLRLEGVWEQSKYGKQLRIDSWEPVIPRTKQGLENYLASGIIKGLNGRAAADIIEHFGMSALTVIKNEPERLLEISSVPKTAVDHFKETYHRGRYVKAIKEFLAPFHVSSRGCGRIFDALGANSIPIIKQRPFKLFDVPGFGYERVDSIAKTLKSRPDDPLRIRAALFFVLEKVSGRDGHLYLPRATLCKNAAATLNKGIPFAELHASPQRVAEVLYIIIERKELILDDGDVYLPRHYQNEWFVARYLAVSLAANKNSVDIAAAMSQAKMSLGILPSKRQEDGVIAAFHSSMSIITGSPGTGKTTCLKLVLAVYKRLYPDGKVLLAAPTGRASRRMAESTGFMEAKTLHSALRLVSADDDEDDQKGKYEPLDADLLVVDEFSMIDQWLAKELFARIARGARLLMVGDPDQLPSVGPGNVFRELINCGMIPVTVLNQIFRQAEESLIPYNAKLINEDNTELMRGDDFVIEFLHNTKATVNLLVEKYLEEVSVHGEGNVQILTPFSTEGIASAKELNLAVRDLVNPPDEKKAEIRIGTKMFRVNDRIMQTRNKNGVSNGDIGFIKAIRQPAGPDPVVVIEFSGERTVEYDPPMLGIVDLSYATTVHKGMGSEFNVVLVPILWDHKRLLSRNLIYTAVTRARLRCYIFGQDFALEYGIHRDKIGERNTKLGFRVKQQCAKLMADKARQAQQLGLTG